MSAPPTPTLNPMKTTILFLALLCGAFAAETPIVFDGGTLDFKYPRNLSIKAGSGQIVIDFKTGNVELPKDMKLPDAAVAFWLRVAEAFPEMRRAIISGNPEPLTTMWGEDYLKAHASLMIGATKEQAASVTKMYFVMIAGSDGRPGYEFGLRSDGVVVWREIKP